MEEFFYDMRFIAFLFCSFQAFSSLLIAFDKTRKRSSPSLLKLLVTWLHSDWLTELFGVAEG